MTVHSTRSNVSSSLERSEEFNFFFFWNDPLRTAFWNDPLRTASRAKDTLSDHQSEDTIRKRQLINIVESVGGAVTDSAQREFFSSANADGHPMWRRHDLKNEVRSLLESAGVENWDGEGTLALSSKTVEVAAKLVDTFPDYIGKPDVSATPHGEVDFDWVVSNEEMLTVSVGPSADKIVFAGLFFETHLNGSEPWTERLPQFIRCCFERLRRHPNAEG